jgi:hypothetical protein
MCESTIYFLQIQISKCVGEQIIMCKIQVSSFLEPIISVTKIQVSTCVQKQIHNPQRSRSGCRFEINGAQPSTVASQSSRTTKREGGMSIYKVELTNVRDNNLSCAKYNLAHP